LVNIHRHSLKTYDQILRDGSLTKREQAVLKIIVASKFPLRDFDILQVFKKGSDNINLVQPRITDLHGRGHLIEGPPGRSPYKSGPVRTSIVNFKVEKQVGMAF